MVFLPRHPFLWEDQSELPGFIVSCKINFKMIPTWPKACTPASVLLDPVTLTEYPVTKFDLRYPMKFNHDFLLWFWWIVPPQLLAQFLQLVFLSFEYEDWINVLFVVLHDQLFRGWRNQLFTWILLLPSRVMSS